MLPYIDVQVTIEGWEVTLLSTGEPDGGPHELRMKSPFAEAATLRWDAPAGISPRGYITKLQRALAAVAGILEREGA